MSLIKLYSYYRSSAAYRVRIVLNYKALDYEIIPINLPENKHFEKAYRQINAQARVPTLIDDDCVIGQSLAIMSYLEEKYPQYPMLPSKIKQRAWVREIMNLIACDIHPLNNLSPWRYLSENLQLNDTQKIAWYHHWLKVGFDALEIKLSNEKHQGAFALGELFSFADACIIPQVYNAIRFNFAMDDYSRIMQIYHEGLKLPAVEKARPENQIDCPD